MTRPLRPSSPQEKLLRQSKAVESLARRPAPLSPGIATAYITSSPGSYTAGTKNVFAPGTTGLAGATSDSSVISVDTATNGGLVFQTPGWFIAYFYGASNAASASRQAQIDLQFNMFDFSANGLAGNAFASDGTTATQFFLSGTGWWCVLPFMISSLNAGDYIGGLVSNSAGFTVSRATLMLARLGAFPT